MKKIILLLCLFLALPVNALISAEEQLNNPALEQRAITIGDTIKCTVCAGQSINGSNAELAMAMRQAIRQQLKKGMSDKQVQDWLVARYGTDILFRPPKSNIIWYIPALILLIITGLYFSRFRRL